MIQSVEESLKKLQVAVKGGGSIVSHAPVFSPDSKTLYIIQKNTLLLYNITTGRLIGKFYTPSAATIVNVVHLVDCPNSLHIFTSSGSLFEVELPSLQIIYTREVNLCPQGWIPIISVLNFIWPIGNSSRASHFYLLCYPQDATLPVLYGVQRPSPEIEEKAKEDGEKSQKDQLPLHYLCKDIVPNLHSVGSGINGRFVAAIQAGCLYVKDITSKGCRWHNSGSRKFTAVAVHPTEWICATGDESGRILIWSNILGNTNVAKSVYHWHTLPVADLCFSVDGSQMFSGGGECTLVKWDLKNTDNKRTLPRMGLPIRHVNSSLRNDLIAVAHADNCIQLVNSHNEIVNKIQNITQCYIPDSVADINITESSLGGQKVFQAGVHLDPNNHSLITNGRPGHLQCYSFREDKHLYNLDITQQNFITAERNNPIPNSDVTHISFSRNGSWLTTGESRIDNKKCTELRLKFWKFDRERQLFVLNTSVEWPHEGGLNGLKMQPIDDNNPSLMAATTGYDKKFKTWGVIYDTSIHGKSEWWNCENIESYRDMKCGPLAFSQDGSLLCVAFERILTIWVTDSNEMKISLCHSKLPENITLVEFGTHQSSHLVIACSGQNIATWDIITSSLLWVAPFHAESLTVDPFSNLAAAFSSKNHLIFFAPDRAEPLTVHKNVSSTKVVSSVFVPNGNSLENSRLKSTVFFMNSSQELCALLPPIDETEETIRIKPETGTSVLTPFAQLIAEKTVYEMRRQAVDLSSRQIGMEGYQVLREIMDQSPHTMPSLTYYCSRLLKALSTPRTATDDANEMEKHVLSSFSKLKTKAKEQSQSDDDDDEMYTSDFEMQTETEPEVKREQKEITFDLDLVAGEDTSWIDSVFQKSS